MKQGYRRLMVAVAALACGLLASTAAVAEVYRWTDENGVTHFSQTPPDAGQEVEIEDVPGAAPTEGAAAGIDFDGFAASGDEEISSADLRRQEIAEASERRRAEQEALAVLCRQTLSRLAQIEPNRRVYYTNEEGETVRMDDEERVAEVEQLRSFLDANCP